MQILELMNYLLLDQTENTVLRFIAKPSISLANKIDEFDQLHNKFSYLTNEKEVNDFFNSLKYLQGKKSKTIRDTKLINIVNFELYQLGNVDSSLKLKKRIQLRIS